MSSLKKDNEDSIAASSSHQRKNSGSILDAYIQGQLQKIESDKTSGSNKVSDKLMEAWNKIEKAKQNKKEDSEGKLQESEKDSESNKTFKTITEAINEEDEETIDNEKEYKDVKLAQEEMKQSPSQQ